MDMDEDRFDTCIRTAFGINHPERDVPPEEKLLEEFIEFVEIGNTDGVKQMLQQNRDLRINSVIYKKTIPYTAMQIAAENDDFLMVKMLLDLGAKPLTKPDKYMGIGELNNEDELTAHLTRLHLYSALTSPSYIALTSDDPVVTALELMGNIQRLINVYTSGHPFIMDYKQLHHKVEGFIVDLLHECDSAKDVFMFLSGKNRNPEEHQHGHYFTLDKAVENEAKRFLADGRCQIGINVLWHQPLLKITSWNGSYSSMKQWLFIVGFLGILQPVFALFFLAIPNSYQLSRDLKCPSIRFLISFFSHLFFTITLIAVSIQLFAPVYTTPSKEMVIMQIGNYYVCAYIIGMCVNIATDIKSMGFVKYVSEMWNVTSMTIVTSFIAEIILMLYVFIPIHAFQVGTEGGSIVYSLAQCMCCITVIASMIYMLHFLQTSTFLGHMLLSLRCITAVTLQFFTIFGLVQISITVTFFFLQSELNFNSFTDTVWTTSWSLFGVHDLALLESTTGFDCNELTSNLTNITTNVTNDNQICVYYATVTSRAIIYYFKLSFYFFYCICVILCLLNIFIAMIADTYAKIQADIDTEWKFVCISTVMQYANRSVTLPPPYNVLEHIRNGISTCFRKCYVVGKNVVNPEGRKTILPVVGISAHDELMKTLLYRYFKGRFPRRQDTTERKDNEDGVK